MLAVVEHGRARKRTELCRAVAGDTYAAFVQKTGATPPPVPVDSLARWLGLQIVPLFSVRDEFSALVSTRENLIGINGRHHPHRQRFSICHELGHILLKHPPESRCKAAEIALFNAEADECAAGLIMPDILLNRWLRITTNIGELARIFDVSRDAMSFRVKQRRSALQKNPGT